MSADSVVCTVKLNSLDLLMKPSESKGKSAARHDETEVDAGGDEELVDLSAQRKRERAVKEMAEKFRFLGGFVRDVARALGIGEERVVLESAQPVQVGLHLVCVAMHDYLPNLVAAHRVHL